MEAVISLVRNIDIDAFDGYTGKPDWHAVYTIQLGELVESGVFDWSKPFLDWSGYAYDEDTYNRLCSYIVARYYWYEISIPNVKEWMQQFITCIRYELCPKYNRFYSAFGSFNPLQDWDEYGKDRTIGSDFPETLLSGNSDYASTGKDNEYEHVRLGSPLDKMEQLKTFRDIDAMFADDLKRFFVSMFSANINGF